MKGRRLARHRGGPAHEPVPALSVHRGCRRHRRRGHHGRPRRGQRTRLPPPARHRAGQPQGQPRRTRSTIRSRATPACSSTWAARCPGGVGPKRSIVAYSASVPAHGLPGRPTGASRASSSARAIRAATTPSAWASIIQGVAMRPLPQDPAAGAQRGRLRHRRRRPHLRATQQPRPRQEGGRSVMSEHPEGHAQGDRDRRPGRRGRPRPGRRVRGPRPPTKRPPSSSDRTCSPFPPRTPRSTPPPASTATSAAATRSTPGR